jgi:predicted choloylglycine hydrolase
MSPIEPFEVHGSHYEVGLAIGERFSEQIHRALDSYPFFREQLLPYHRSPEGQVRYHDLLELNRLCYPDYVSELEGLAQGARRPFEELFLVNLRGEYREHLRELGRGCFDCALVTDGAALIGHNEDGSPSFRGSLYLVQAQVEGKPGFTALSYPGFLCGNALGFNGEGICFSIDNVRPRETKLGVGRHFIARSLLEAASLDDAIGRVTVSGRASGFGYTIGSIHERRVVYVEAAPEVHQLREIRGCYVHANHYLELAGVAQIVDPSSWTRVERANAILESGPPLDAAGVLSLLGDEANEEYPIYRTATPPDKSATFHTVLFDLDARRLRIYTGHPVRDAAEFVELDLK